MLLDQLRAHAAARPRFGYRRLHLLLRREGVVVNHKRIYRLYRLEGLSVRTKRRKRMVAAPRTVLPAPTRPSERWSMRGPDCHKRLLTLMADHSVRMRSKSPLLIKNRAPRRVKS